MMHSPRRLLPLLLLAKAASPSGSVPFEVRRTQEVAATTTCDLGELFAHMHTIEEMCCSDGNPCESGYPGPGATCSHDCAVIFEPFWYVSPAGK